MPDRPGLMVPMDEHSAAMRMMIDEQRRMRDTMEKVNDTMGDLRETMAEMKAENRAAAEQRSANTQRINGHERRFEKVEGRLVVVEDWKTGETSKKALLGATSRHPIVLWLLGLLGALAMGAYAIATDFGR